MCRNVSEQLHCPTDGTTTILKSGLSKNALAFQPGDIVNGRYRITGTIGRGGFGAVYSAEHTGTKQDVALKMLAIDPSTVEDDVVRRFFQEAQVTAGLRHNNTVRVFDIGQAEEGPLFLAMELLHGLPLDKVLRKLEHRNQAMSEQQTLDIAIPVLKSLAEAHDAKLVHRDMKPGNIMLAQHGDDDPIVKVLDFGIARTADSSLTGSGKSLGTPAYMSPEQCRGKQVDGRSDLYSLGIIMYRCITGRLPFEDEDMMSLMFKQAHEAPPDPSSLAKTQLSDSFVAALLKTLAKKPEERWVDAREMRKALESVRAGTSDLSTAGASTAGEVDATRYVAFPALEVPGRTGGDAAEEEQPTLQHAAMADGQVSPQRPAAGVGSKPSSPSTPGRPLASSSGTSPRTPSKPVSHDRTLVLATEEAGVPVSSPAKRRQSEGKSSLQNLLDDDEMKAAGKPNSGSFKSTTSPSHTAGKAALASQHVAPAGSVVKSGAGKAGLFVAAAAVVAVAAALVVLEPWKSTPSRPVDGVEPAVQAETAAIEEKKPVAPAQELPPKASPQPASLQPEPKPEPPAVIVAAPAPVIDVEAKIKAEMAAKEADESARAITLDDRLAHARKAAALAPSNPDYASLVTDLEAAKTKEGVAKVRKAPGKGAAKSAGGGDQGGVKPQFLE